MYGSDFWNYANVSHVEKKSKVREKNKNENRLKQKQMNSADFKWII